MRASAVLLPVALAAAVAPTACDPGSAPSGTGVARLPAEPELDEEELGFLRILNEYRTSVGAPELAPVDEIDAAADAHSEDMGQRSYFAHEALEPAPYGVLPWDRMCHFGFGPACDMSTTMGENIAAGYPDAFSAFTAWRGSPGHDANMREPAFRGIGIGRVSVPGSIYGVYWTTDFAGTAPDCACADGQLRSCDTETCGPGVEECRACEFGDCHVPDQGDDEVCGDRYDNDCDGEVDEEDDCGPRCEPEPEVCDGDDDDCDGEVDEGSICDVRCFPLDELCDGVDNDCDLTVDEGCPCDARPASPFCGLDEGRCTTGTQECEFGPDGGVLTVCRGAVEPTPETCDEVDEDCDGLVDEGDVCAAPEGCECRAGGGQGGRLGLAALLLAVALGARRAKARGE